jgi:ABC-type nitrate/sulfonate/bicarbonate transport system substrate-binding protein
LRPRCSTRIPWYWALALIVASLLAQPAGAIAAERVVLQLRWDHQFQFAGYYAALWQGYYAAAGLDVEIRSAAAPNGGILKPVAEVANINADFGIGSADILVARDKGVPLVITATIFQSSDIGFVAKKTSQISSPADLIGRRLSRIPGGLADTELKAMLWAEGIRFDTITASNTLSHPRGAVSTIGRGVDRYRRNLRFGGAVGRPPVGHRHFDPAAIGLRRRF